MDSTNTQPLSFSHPMSDEDVAKMKAAVDNILRVIVEDMKAGGKHVTVVGGQPRINPWIIGAGAIACVVVAGVAVRRSRKAVAHG